MKKALSIYPFSSVGLLEGKLESIKWRALVWRCGAVSGKHVDLWTWRMKQGRHYRWMAGSGCIDRTPKLIKPFPENVQWIQLPVHLALMIPWVANDRSTAICHRTITQAVPFVTNSCCKQFFPPLRYWHHVSVVIVAVRWCWGCEVNREMKVSISAEKTPKQTNRGAAKTCICTNHNKRSQSNSCKIVQHNFVDLCCTCASA